MIREELLPVQATSGTVIRASSIDVVFFAPSSLCLLKLVIYPPEIVLKDKVTIAIFRRKSNQVHVETPKIQFSHLEYVGVLCQDS